MNVAKKIQILIIFLLLWSTFCWCSPNMQNIQNTTFERKNSLGQKQNVTLKSFSISKKMVTLQEWSAYLKSSKKDNIRWQNEVLSSLDDYSIKQVQTEWPAWEISWIEAIEYCNWLSKQENLQPCYIIVPDKNTEWKVEWKREANGYRLPTLAEWQLVSEIFSPKFTKEKVLATNWLYENSKLSAPHKVGELPPNSFGLYDIFGNIKEFCWDYYNPDAKWSDSVTDPLGPVDFIPDPDEVYYKVLLHETRVVVGGIWGMKIQYLLEHPISSVVSVSKEFIGIRVVRNSN